MSPSSSTHSRKLSSRRCKISTSTHQNKTHARNNKQKCYIWTNTPCYKRAATHRAFTKKERDALDKAVNTYRETLDFPYGVEELIDWKSISIPRRTAQECKDEWYTSFGPDSQSVCLTRGKWFWRIQYYNDIVDSQQMNAGHPAFVYHGVLGSTHPHSYLIPHTSAKEVQQLIREKKNQGYLNDGIHTGAVYLLYDDLRKMPVGTSFTVGIDGNGGEYGIQRVQVKEHFEHYTVLHDVEHPSWLYEVFRGSVFDPPLYNIRHTTLHSTQAVYNWNAEYPLIVHPNPHDPVYRVHWKSPSTKPPPSLMKRFMHDWSAEWSRISRKKVGTAAFNGAVGGVIGTVMASPFLKQLRNRRKRTTSATRRNQNQNQRHKNG